MTDFEVIRKNHNLWLRVYVPFHAQSEMETQQVVNTSNEFCCLFAMLTLEFLRQGEGPQGECAYLYSFHENIRRRDRYLKIILWPIPCALPIHTQGTILIVYQDSIPTSRNNLKSVWERIINKTLLKLYTLVRRIKDSIEERLQGEN